MLTGQCLIPQDFILYFPQVKSKSYPEHIDSLISSFGLLDVPLMITHQNIHTQKKVLKIFWGFQVPQIHLCIAIDSIFFTISKFDKRILQVPFNFASGNSRPCHVKRIYRIQRNWTQFDCRSFLYRWVEAKYIDLLVFCSSFWVPSSSDFSVFVK